jgi:prepilin-type N-terminal cleavage/methylation domain-containing protein
MTSTTGRISSGRGFTLLELVVVMVVLCAALAMVAPSLRGFLRGTSIGDTADQIVALTRWARSQAVADAMTYRWSHDSSARAHGLSRLEGQTFVPLGQEMGRAFFLPDGLELTLDLTAGLATQGIGFYPDGSADIATIRLRDLDGAEILIGTRTPTEDFLAVDAKGVRP